MSATSSVQSPHPDARKYGAFQNHIYAQGTFPPNTLPTVTTDPNKLEAQAEKALSARSYAYVAGGAGERATMDANRLAFRQWKIIPRMLRDTTHRDLRTTIFGQQYDSPLLFAPIGVQSIFHEDGEPGVASIAAELGVPYIMSTASSHSIEAVAAASGAGPRWFQLYWPHDEEITLSLLARAKENGFSTLVVTLDTWALAWRPWDLDGAYVPFIKGVGDAVGFSDPVFRRKYKEASGKEVEDDVVAAAYAWTQTVFSGRAHSWAEVDFLRKHWDGPLVLKGIQHPADAREAVARGVDGIVVSNHGGRQCDGAIGSLTMLPEIVEAVGDKVTVLFDSGVRTGVDCIKALALGAKGVLVGRPWCYGLGIGGKAGAKAAMQGLLADLDQSMGLAGIRDIAGCSREMVRKVEYAGERFSSN
ncbi:uncharacterized protein K452DRAFT_303610 [Aplosporella prunicola CBS 121167]|uniref:FMN hydroxy acid dehydrogenase domain-containing protein n=1 Tax=Aplosporella prunicola CBS 121167 TaxID=1176127 RepID=A0A6A6AVY1_9PEZI|nr:uncharacterized protein K452DRAFT_303610 [Aplosporella prunicola CBS 121167]KAF2135343.1 hypothetical protein K452DRAFT_303610 [Aplosporella prunicola CBS 121167]